MSHLIQSSRQALPYLESFLAGFGAGVLVGVFNKTGVFSK